MKKSVSIDPQIYKLIDERFEDYSTAAKYTIQVTGDKDQALNLLASAEKLKKLSKEYQATGSVSMKSLPPSLSPEILFGVPESERTSKFEELITGYRTDFEELSQKARTVLAGIEKVKKPDQVKELRALASKYIEQAKSHK